MDEIPNIDNIDQEKARDMLQRLCDNGFDGLRDMTALALGRDQELIDGMLDGRTEIDEDLIMKMLGIANERGIDIGQDDAVYAAGSN